MKRHTHLITLTLAALVAATPLAAQAQPLQAAQAADSHTSEALPGTHQAQVLPDIDHFGLTLEDKYQLAQVIDRREGGTIQELKRDPARAALLSTLYPGLGQLYIGNDLQRSLWIMGGGTVIIAGSIVGFGLLSGRPPEASALGNLLIVGVLLGYHLWNIRDAYVQAAEFNKLIEDEYRASWLDQIHFGMQGETLSLSWSTSL